MYVIGYIGRLIKSIIIRFIWKKTAKIYNSKSSLYKKLESEKSTFQEVEKLLREYSKIFITKDDFIRQYGNDSEIIELLNNNLFKIKWVSFFNGDKTYDINMECQIKAKYNTQILFCTKTIYHDDPDLRTLIRDKKINEII